MIDQKYKLLINKAIDGALSAEDEKRLRIYLEHNPEARHLLEDLRQTSAVLNKLSEIEPPPALKKRILNAIDISTYTEQAKMPIIKSLLPGWLLAPKAKLAYAFILGLIISALTVVPYLLTRFQTQQLNTSYLSGTIKKSGNTNFNIIHSIPIDRSGINGSIKIKKFQSSVILSFDLEAAAEIEIVLAYDSTQLHFENFEPVAYSKYTLNYEKGVLKINLTDSIKFSLFFTLLNPSTQLMLDLTHADNPILSQSIILK
jgi:hypothetical protein